MLKRIGSVVLTVAAIGSITASCAKNESGGAGSTSTATTSASGASPAAFTTITPGTLTVGSCLDYPPFESVKNGDPQGFDVALTDAIAAKLGYEEGRVRWVKANFDTIFTAVANGQFDVVAAAVTATGTLGEKRAQKVAFSDFYFSAQQALSVNPTQTPDLTSPDQLTAGDTVGAQKGTTGAAWAVENLQPKGVTIKTYQSGPDAFRDLSAGNLTAVVVDEKPSYGIAATMQDVKVVAPIDTNEKYAFAFSPTNTALVDAWNAAFQEVVAEGTYATIFQNYFPGIPVPAEWQPST